MIMTREEIEKCMDALARKYVETHDKKIIEELYKLACELRKLEQKILSDYLACSRNWITERARLTPDLPPLLISGFPVWRVSIDNPHRSELTGHENPSVKSFGEKFS